MVLRVVIGECVYEKMPENAMRNCTRIRWAAFI